ncbi:MAG: RNA polymerase sigma factor [Bacteroidia bacterium]|nr:RNA polymerase sigma factor [Bacteroidia bacterium]
MAENHTDKLNSILAQCIEKQPKAQKQLFDLLSPKMYAVCLRYSKDTDEAKDILQEGFIKVFGNLNRFEHKGSFEGWVKRIFINTSIEFYRKAQRENIVDNIDDVPEKPIDPQTISLLKVADLMKLVEKLPKGYKTVFNLFAIEGFKHEEIAQLLGISENTSKSQLHKARLFLQELVIKENLK